LKALLPLLKVKWPVTPKEEEDEKEKEEEEEQEEDKVSRIGLLK
jgi:hypothetical protein